MVSASVSAWREAWREAQSLPCVPILYTVGLSAIFWIRNSFWGAVWAAWSSKEIVNLETRSRGSKSYFVVAAEATTVLEHFGIIRYYSYFGSS